MLEVRYDSQSKPVTPTWNRAPFALDLGAPGVAYLRVHFGDVPQAVRRKVRRSSLSESTLVDSGSKAKLPDSEAVVSTKALDY